MAQRPSVVAAEATSVPEPSAIARVATFAREPFVEAGEDAAEVLAPGSVRRHAFEAACAEIEAGATVPSQKWRRRWSLLLGLDRALHAETPVLADGTTLNPHQVDALSGTYAALLADAQRRARGGSGSDGDALLLSFEDDEPTEVEEPPPAPSTPDPADDEPEPLDDDEDPADDESFDADPELEGVTAPSPEDDEDDESVDTTVELEELPEAEPGAAGVDFGSLYDDEAEEDVDEDIDVAALDDPNAHKRFWFEHATGAGKTVAAMGFVEACRTGGVLILTHRRNLVDQFIAELETRGYGERLSKPLLGDADDPNGPVTIETYQWFVRNAGQISGAYTVVICDEAHTALGEKTSATIRAWTGPIFIGMTATGALIARHVTDLFPTQTSRFDLAQAARRGVIAPLRSLRIPPGPGVRTIAKVPLRKGEVDMEFDQDELAKLLDQAPFNLAIADLYKTRFRNTPGVVYTAGVKHAYNVAESFRALDMKAEAVSGETPKRELAKILADYEAGEIDVLVNAQLLAEGWNSPRATICMHLAPTASKRIYQQRVGRVTRRHPGKEAGVVIDFVHPATTNDDPVVTLHSLLDRDVYRGGAIVVGPVRRGRGRRVKVERRVLPVTPDIERRRLVFERELWRIAVEMLDWGEQRVWAALAGAKASPTNWRRGRAMLNFDRSGELRRQFLVTALERNRNPQLRMRAIQEISLLREAEPFDTAIDFIGQWPREERREASRVMLQAMADRRMGRRDQATAWIWRLAGYTRDVHEEYAAQRWPATKHLLGLLVNSSGAAHARNARRLVHAARQHDRRLQAALLAAAVAHSPEAEEVLREARTRLARKPGALSRDLLKDFPNGKRRKKRTRNKKKGNGNGEGNGRPENVEATDGNIEGAEQAEGGNANGQSGNNGQNNNGQNGNGQGGNGGRSRSRRSRSRGGRRRGSGNGGQQTDPNAANAPQAVSDQAASDTAPVEASADRVGGEDGTPPRRRRIRGGKAAAEGSASTDAASEAPEQASGDTSGDDAPTPARRRTRRRSSASADASTPVESRPLPSDAAPEPSDRSTAEPRRPARTRPADAERPAQASTASSAAPDLPAAASDEAPKRAPRRRTRASADATGDPATAAVAPPATPEEPAQKPAPRRRTSKAAVTAEAGPDAAPATAAAPKATTRRRATAATAAAEDAPAKAPAKRRAPAKASVPADATTDAPVATKAAPKTTRTRAAAKATTTADPRAATGTAAAKKAAPAKKAAAKPRTAAKTTTTAAARKTATAKTSAATTATEKPAAAKTVTARKPASAKAATKTATAKAPAAKAPAAKPAAPKKAATKTAATKAAPKATAAEATATKAAPKTAAAKATAAKKPTTAAATTKATAAKKTTAAKAATAAKATTRKPAAKATAATTKAPTAAKKPATRRASATATATAAPVKKPAARRAATKKDDA